MSISPIINIGYTCPACGKRVTVLRSSNPPPDRVDVIESECPCGFMRPIAIEEIQSLEMWQEKTA